MEGKSCDLINVKEMGCIIKDKRSALDMSQRELAEEAGITQPEISQIERGLHTLVSIEVMARICNALGTDVRDVIVLKKLYFGGTHNEN